MPLKLFSERRRTEASKIIRNAETGIVRHVVIYDFCNSGGCADGGIPSRISIDSSGNLLGMTRVGGATNDGTLYNLNGALTVVASFKCAPSKCKNGETPDGGVLADSADNLYGTMSEGGLPDGGGTIFKLTPSTP